MSINCANITSEEYKKLKAKFGEDKANYLWNKLNGTIPEDIYKLVPIEFKKAQILMPYTIVKALKAEGIDYTKLTHQELKDMIDPDVLEGLAYRIPNQAAASNDAFEIVGILPENAGDTIIAFKEITTKTGSDFDIDKAYVMLPNFKFENGRFSTIKDDSKKGLQNERLRLSNLMLSNPSKYTQLMKPLDTDWLKTLILGNKKEKIEPLIKEDKVVQDLNFYTGTNQVFVKSTFDNTKTLVGPIAKNMTNHNAIKHDGITYTDTFLGLGMFKTIKEETTIIENPIIEKQTETVSEPAGENQFSYKGKTIDTEFQLTKGQESALQQLIDFSGSNDKFITLQGYAGTGKTATIGYLAKYLDSKKFLYTAPTHAATAELAFATVKTGNKQFPMTIASSIRTAKNKSTGLEETTFTKKFSERLSYAGNILVIDELSMLSAKDLKGLQLALKTEPNIKVIFMGDPLQIPEVDTTNPEYKQISKAFSSVKQVKLTEIKRTSNDTILNILSNLRKKPDGSIPKTENTDKLKYLNSSEFNELLVNTFKEEPESTVLISYTNSGVAHSNQKIREALGFNGSPKVGEVVTGYLGYSSKQVEKGNVANSIRYVISDIKKNDSKYEIEFTSSKLKNLADLDVRGVSEKAGATFLQLSNSDSFNFEDLNEKDFEVNNAIVSDKMEMLYNAKKDALKNPRYWDSYYRAQQDVSTFFQNVNLGNTYIYNPATEKMELYTYNLHKGIDSDLKVEKGIDYGYAITVHKSQGSTIKNVFYDTNTLPNNSGSKLVNDKEEIGTEKGSLNYVAMSRASDLLVIKADDNSLFYPAENLLKDKKEEPKQEDKTTTFEKKNILDIKPIQSVDKKATIKASIATQYIGFGEGIPNSSTEAYRQQAGNLANTGNYSSNDVIFVSIGGKRPSNNLELRKSQQDKTIKEAIKALNAGATIITDNESYIESSDYNEGEKRLFKNLKSKENYDFFEKTIDDQKLGFWKLKENKTNIYNQLGNKTKSEHIIIKSWGELKDATTAITPEGIISTRIKNTEEHFGNPFSHDPAGKTQGLIKTETIKEAVEKYTDWVINSKDNRANWIREQLKSGKLKGQPVLYYKELGEPSHATALDYLINKYNWNNTESQKTAVENKDYDKTKYNQGLQQYFINKIDTETKVDQTIFNIAAEIDGGISELINKLPTINIPLSKIIPTQKGINTERLKSPKLSEDKAFVIKQGEFYYIEDGHHRIIKDIINKKPIYAKVYDSNISSKENFNKNNSRTITTSKKESLVSTDIDEDGNSVEETLTGYMNAIVDGVKDPYIVKGNINLFTGGIAFMLARAGVSRNWISAFMVQPIIVDLVKQMNISESRISEISRDEKGETNKALDVILKRYGSQLTGADFKSDLTKDNLKNEDGDIKTTFEDLKKQLDNPNPAMQLKVLKQFFQFQETSFKLSDLMTIMSADTDGATKNDITATMRDNLFHSVINNNTFTGLEKVIGYSKEENGEIKIDDTKYIGTFHKNSVQFFKKISKEQFITSSDSFKHAAYTIANYAGYSELKSKKHVEIITLIEQELFASFIEESKILSFDTIEELQLNVIGPNELIQRTNQQMAIEVNNQNKALLEIEGRILTDVERMSVMSPYLKKLEYLKSQKNLAQRVSDAQLAYPDNLFLKSLLVDVNPYMNGKPSTIGLNSKNLNKDAKNTLYLYWEDLLNKDEKLAEDLIKYSFYASGLSNNFGAFFEHIPTNWLVKKGLNDFMTEKLQSLNESHTSLLHLQKQVMRHLHKDDRIVPTISDKIVTEFKSPSGNIVPKQFYLTIPVFNANNLEIGINNEDEKEYKKYIKRTIVDEMNDTKKSTMYELQGYINTLDPESKPIKTLLYKVISPLGSKTKLGYVREYGNEKASIFSENITMLPANIKAFVDNLKKTDPKPIQILNSPIDKSFKKDDEMDENDPIFCAIK